MGTHASVMFKVAKRIIRASTTLMSGLALLAACTFVLSVSNISLDAKRFVLALVSTIVLTGTMIALIRAVEFKDEK